MCVCVCVCVLVKRRCSTEESIWGERFGDQALEYEVAREERRLRSHLGQSTFGGALFGGVRDQTHPIF